MHALFDMYKVDLCGSTRWLGSVQSYSAALFEIELTAAERLAITLSLPAKPAIEPY